MNITADFVTELVRHVPPLDAVLREHLRDYGELLPHVAMGDITRSITQLHEASVQGSQDAKRSVSLALALLEEALASSSPSFASWSLRFSLRTSIALTRPFKRYAPS